jgi:hypothetical protein
MELSMNDKLCVYCVEDTALHLTDYLFCSKDEYKLKRFRVFKTAYYDEHIVYSGCFVISLNALTYFKVYNPSAGYFKYIITKEDLPKITYEQALDIQNHITKQHHWLKYNTLIADDIQQLINLVFINWDLSRTV